MHSVDVVTIYHDCETGTCEMFDEHVPPCPLLWAPMLAPMSADISEGMSYVVANLRLCTMD